mmetsp:Transcript_88156/g.248019  ORF Transcript_88156/g.248019 Transcript_88156/m.248019 type:complete len:229 (-) Transcript_88156:13-699(-)
MWKPTVALRSIAFSGATYAAWRCFYRSKFGEHVVRMKADFELDVSQKEGFVVMSDPGLLDETTPWWFHIVIRERSMAVVQELLGHVEMLTLDAHTGEGFAEDAGGRPHRQEPFIISYWIFFGYLLPSPWTSEVAPICLDREGRYRLTYRQRVGPYSSFEHTHLVSESRSSADDSTSPCCLVEDTIVANVLGEPILNGFASVLLKWILISRGSMLTARYGGRVLKVAAL